ncbi:hypothetical protein [Streptomyces sp. NPDC101234]|uniref:hypothetical protein n=1 Tax=Streptomyces sp. NPDC101234 TaxID=3366138 RepID=UPI0038225A2F
MSTADASDTVIARADTCGFTTGPWDVTVYRASITSTEAWLRILDSHHLHHSDTLVALALTTLIVGYDAVITVCRCQFRQRWRPRGSDLHRLTPRAHTCLAACGSNRRTTAIAKLVE